MALALVPGCAVAAPCGDWPEWQRFKSDFISEDGRVTDPLSPRLHTVSEGQGYALFFALVADDRAAFERLRHWTVDNLAGGDLRARLPAWHWGRRDDGRWGVLDDNAAADADLWIAYALAEAGTLWKHRGYRAQARGLGARILAEETAELPRLGRVLLPGPRGFTPAPGRWRLNPSYSPIQVLRGLHALQPAQGWNTLIAGSERMLRDSAPAGFAPDWATYVAATGFEADAPSRDLGSYDAIRVYLWAGLLDEREPLRARLLQALRPMADLTAARGAPPERIDVRLGKAEGAGDGGFSAALLPLLQALGLQAPLRVQRQRLAELPPGPQAYYARALELFATGFMQQRFRFDARGRLQRPPPGSCRASR